MCSKAIRSWQGDWPRGCQVLPDSATKDFLPLETLGGLANLLQSRLKLAGLSYSCQGKSSMELSPSCARGEQTWESAPKVSSREKALEISPGAKFFIDWLKTKHEQRRD